MRVEVVASTFRNDVSHQVCIDPLDDPGIHISHLEEVVDAWVPCCPSAVDGMTHPPALVALLSDLKAVLDDDRHPWNHIQKDRPLWLGLVVDPVVNGHVRKERTPVLATNVKGCCRNGRNQAKPGIMLGLTTDPCFAASPQDS